MCLFWLLLAVPGLAALAYFRPADEQDGVLGTVGLAYVISFALLSPACIAGYWLELPLWSFSGYLTALVVAGLCALYARRKLWWHPRRPSIGQASAAFVLTLGLVLGSAIHTELGGDSRFHVGRIRYLVGSGLNNADPYTGTGFLHLYHTNIYHAVMAAGSQLTGCDVLVFWSSSLPWAKLAVACGIYLLALRVSGSHSAAWIAVLWRFVGDVLHAYTFYPNCLAPGWLLPIGLGCAFAAFTTTNARYHLVLLFACSLVTAEFHGLYSGFLACIVASACIPLSLFRVIARPAARRRAVELLIAAGLAVAIALPFLYIARSTHRPAEVNYAYNGGSPHARGSSANRMLRLMKVDESGEIYAPVEQIFGGRDVQVAAGIAFVLLFWRRRDQAAMLFPAFVVPATVLMVPAMATPVANLLGAGWILQRLISVISVPYIALIASGVGVVLEQLKSRRYVTPAIAVSLLLLGLRPIGGFSTSMIATSANLLWLVPDNDFLRREYSGSMRTDQEMLAKAIPAGSTVLVHPFLGRELAMLHYMRFIRVSRGHSGVPDLDQRTHDLHKLMHVRHQRNESTRNLLQKYNIRYCITGRRGRLRWRFKSQDIVGQTDRLTVIRIHTDSGNSATAP